MVQDALFGLLLQNAGNRPVGGRFPLGLKPRDKERVRRGTRRSAPKAAMLWEGMDFGEAGLGPSREQPLASGEYNV